MRFLVLLIATAGLAACGTTYRPPAVEAPPLWQGSAAREIVEDSIETFPGDVGEGDVIARMEIVPKRTGRLAAPVTYERLSGDDVTLPAGTPMFVSQFSLVTTTTVNYAPVSSRTQSPFNNPIEWCALPPDGDVVCIFWQNYETSLYISSMAGSGFNSTPTNVNGREGPVPLIEEGPVEFDRTLVLEVRMGRMRNNRLILNSFTVDQPRGGEPQENRAGRSEVRYEIGETVEAAVYNGRFRITPLFDEDTRRDDRRARIEVVSDEFAFGNANLEEILRLLLERAEQRREANTPAEPKPGQADTPEPDAEEGS